MTHRDRPERPLLVPVADLRGRTGERRRVDVGVCLEGLGLSSAWIEPTGEIDLDLMIEALSTGFTVTGHVAAPWVGECRRCLGPVNGMVDVEVREVFSPDPVDEEVRSVDDEHLDLEPMVREAILLELPLAPLCSESCRGPQGPYEVASGESDGGPDPRWAGLDELRFDPPEPDEG